MTQKHILIVEDEMDARLILSEIAEYSNMDATQTANAEDALVELASNQYHAIIIDIGLPGMSGLELIAHIRQQNIETPCVAVTAFHTSKMRHDALKAGFDRYFRKPLNLHQFVEELQDIIQ